MGREGSTVFPADADADAGERMYNTCDPCRSKMLTFKLVNKQLDWKRLESFPLNRAWLGWGTKRTFRAVYTQGPNASLNCKYQLVTFHTFRQTLQMSSRSQLLHSKGIFVNYFWMYSSWNHQLKTIFPCLHNCGPQSDHRSGFSWEDVSPHTSLSFDRFFFVKSRHFWSSLSHTGGCWGPERPRADYPGP